MYVTTLSVYIFIIK